MEQLGATDKVPNKWSKRRSCWQTTCVGRLTSHRTSDKLQRPDDRPPPEIQYHRTRSKSSEIRHLPDVWSSPSHRTTDSLQKSGETLPEKNRRTSGAHQNPEPRDRPDVRQPPDVRHCLCIDLRVSTHVPLSLPLDYIYLSPTSVLGLAKHIMRS